jgi:hypothetical protein
MIYDKHDDEAMIHSVSNNRLDSSSIKRGLKRKKKERKIHVLFDFPFSACGRAQAVAQRSSLRFLGKTRTQHRQVHKPQILDLRNTWKEGHPMGKRRLQSKDLLHRRIPTEASKGYNNIIKGTIHSVIPLLIKSPLFHPNVYPTGTVCLRFYPFNLVSWTRIRIGNLLLLLNKYC